MTNRNSERLREIADGIDAVLGKLSKWGWDDYMDLVRGMDTDLRAFADELDARVAVVRPTRDQVVQAFRDSWRVNAFPSPEAVIDALIELGLVAVSDSQETP